MDGFTIREYMYKLARRRDEITRAMERLRDRSEAEQHRDWIDQAEVESRLTLRDRLSDVYATELQRIDKALERIAKTQYGDCVACHQPIDGARLQAAPEAEFCSSCQAMREQLENV
jgi:RNA polymerase-binding transcription factor DksA